MEIWKRQLSVRISQLLAELRRLDRLWVMRAKDRLPKQGTKEPWKVVNNYLLDKPMLEKGRIDDGVLEFENAWLSPRKDISPEEARDFQLNAVILCPKLLVQIMSLKRTLWICPIIV